MFGILVDVVSLTLSMMILRFVDDLVLLILHSVILGTRSSDVDFIHSRLVVHQFEILISDRIVIFLYRKRGN